MRLKYLLQVVQNLQVEIALNQIVLWMFGKLRVKTWWMKLYLMLLLQQSLTVLELPVDSNCF